MVPPVPPRPLLTPRLRLEPWSEDHTEMLVSLAGLPEVVRYIGDGAPWSEGRALELDARNRAHWRGHGFGWRAAIDRETEAQIGLAALNFAGEGAGVDAGEYEIGWWFHPSVWGCGFAREAAIAVRDEGVQRLGAPSLVARIQPGNAASLRLAGAIGMQWERDGMGRAGEPIAVLRLTAARSRAPVAS
jgi:RimJ/RimL family protein N-acetyltransferase